MTGRRQLIFFFLILILGAALRFWAIGDKSLNDDEFWVLSEARPGVRYILFEQWRKDIHPPLNLLFYRLWMKGGEGDGFLRYPSAVFSTLTIPVIILLARRVFGATGPALLAGLLFAVSPFALFYGQYAKGYALLGLLSAASGLLFFRTLEPGGRRNLHGLVAVNILGAYLHYSMLLVILAENLAYFWGFLLRRVALSGKDWAGGQALTALLFAPWAYPFLDQWLGGRDFVLGDGLKFVNPGLKVVYVFFSFSLGESVSPRELTIVVPAALGFGAAFLWGLGSGWRGKGSPQLLLPLFAVPLLIGLVRPAMTPKHLYLLLPFYLLWVGLGIVRLHRRSRTGGWILAGAVVAVSLVSAGNLLRGEQLHGPRAPWKEVAARIQAGPMADAPVLLYPAKPGGTYRYSRMLARYLPGIEPRLIPIGPEEEEEEIARRIAGLPAAPFWAVLHCGFSRPMEKHREFIKERLGKRFHLVESRAYGPGEHFLETHSLAPLNRRRIYHVLELQRYRPVQP